METPEEIIFPFHFFCKEFLHGHNLLFASSNDHFSVILLSWLNKNIFLPILNNPKKTKFSPLFHMLSNSMGNPGCHLPIDNRRVSM
jgi:hypothetical protein